MIMQLESIGRNIRHYRLQKKMRQEDLAEKANLSVNYIGMIERAEKIPSLETFIAIANALRVSADLLLCDVIDTGYTVKASVLTEKLAQLTPEEKRRFYAIADAYFDKG